MKPIFTSNDKAAWPKYAGWANIETFGPGPHKARKLSFFESLENDPDILADNNSFLHHSARFIALDMAELAKHRRIK